MVEEKIYNLLARRYANELNATEQVELAAWLVVEENAAIAEQLLTIWQAAHQMEPLQIDKTAAWQKVKNKHAANKSRFKIGAWAAAAALLIAAGVGYTYLPKIDTYPAIALAQDVVYKTTNATDTLILADGSQMILLPNSEARIDKNYGKLNRIVQLHGTAHFTSVRGNYALTVINGQTRVEDISTAFWVCMQAGKQWVKVTQGAVKLWHSDLSLLLTQNDSAKVQNNKIIKIESTLYPADVTNEKNAEPVNIEPATTDMQHNALDFSSTELQTVVAIINKQYHSQLEIGSAAIRGCKFTATFKNESLETIIEILQETFNLEINKSNNKIILLGKGCN